MENSLPGSNRFLLSLCLYVVSFAVPAVPTFAQPPTETSEDYFALITEYVDKIDNIYDGTWIYTLTEEDKLANEITVRHVDPSKPFLESDVLIAVNGMPPTVADIKEHQRRLKKRIQRRALITSRREPKTEEEKRKRRLEQNGNEKERFLAMLIPESISLVKREGALLHLRFRALEEDREEIFMALQGTLIIDTEREFIQEVQVRNTADFSPFFLTEVEEAYVSLNFDLVNGRPIQQNMNWKLVGQAFLFKDLDGEREVTWTDFVKTN
jgi:hypothetical protein